MNWLALAGACSLIVGAILIVFTVFWRETKKHERTQVEKDVECPYKLEFDDIN